MASRKRGETGTVAVIEDSKRPRLEESAPLPAPILLPVPGPVPLAPPPPPPPVALPPAVAPAAPLMPHFEPVLQEGVGVRHPLSIYGGIFSICPYLPSHSLYTEEPLTRPQLTMNAGDPIFTLDNEHFCNFDVLNKRGADLPKLPPTFVGFAPITYEYRDVDYPTFAVSRMGFVNGINVGFHYTVPGELVSVKPYNGAVRAKTMTTDFSRGLGVMVPIKNRDSDDLVDPHSINCKTFAYSHPNYAGWYGFQFL